MILSGKEILQQLGHKLEIDPFDEKQLNPNSYNLRLHNTLLVYQDRVLDMKKPNEAHEIVIPDEGMILEPGRLFLGRTMEHTSTQEFVPMIDGRSSVARLGLFIHISAGMGNVGSKGYWTLEIFCVQPVRIYPWVEICQIFYHRLEGQYEAYQSNKYNNNKGIQPSFMYKDFESIKEKDL